MLENRVRELRARFKWTQQDLANAIGATRQTIVLLGLFFKQIAEWRTARKHKKGIMSPTKRETRSREIWDKYGIPGLALLAPILVGTDIAAILALTFGSSKSIVLG